MNTDLKTNVDLAGIGIPDRKLAREITELVRDTEPALLHMHPVVGRRRNAKLSLTCSCQWSSFRPESVLLRPSESRSRSWWWMAFSACSSRRRFQP